MITVQDYANERGCSRQAVYNMLNKYQLRTEQGISNGKSTQFLPEETVERLNQLIHPTTKEISTLSDTLSLQLAEREGELRKEIAAAKDEVKEAKDETLRVKDDLAREKDETRKQALAEVANVEHKFSERLDAQQSSFQKILKAKDEEIASLKDEVFELKRELEERNRTVKQSVEREEYAVEHPFRAFRENYKKNKEIKNASAKGNESTSNSDS